MKRWIPAVVVFFIFALVGLRALAEDNKPEPPPELPREKDREPPQGPAASPWKAFHEVVAVLQHPRCQNCHPAGDAPKQGEDGRPHHMMITRDSADLGLPCSSCHRDSTPRGKGMPPGVPGWRMPPADTPMVFEERSPEQLCAQLKDPAQNGSKSLPDIVHHVENDALVLYGWDPGEGREKIPTSHERFVALMKQWIEAGAPCGEVAEGEPSPTPKP